MKHKINDKLRKGFHKILTLGTLLTFSFVLLAGCGENREQEREEEKPVTYDLAMKHFNDSSKGETISCWYTRETDKKWLEGAAAAFEKQYGTSVNLVYYDGVNFFEDMNKANQGGAGPDLYIMGNDQLELAKTSGMAMETDELDAAFWKGEYPEVACRAVTYQGKQYGYPVYFDTYCLVYDANLLKTAPASIDDILAFADEYEDTGSTKAIFRWDVADPYVNSMFLASYADLFGKDGDDAGSFQIVNEKTVASMEYFQSLSAYLWMDKNNISHDTVKNRIQEGTLVLGLCKSDILPILYELQNKTDSEVNYQVAYVPSLTAELASTTFSTTYSAVVNPYSRDLAKGNMFALFLSLGYKDQQYAGNGKLSVVEQGDKLDAFQQTLYAQYIHSTPVPKVMVLGDYLNESAIAFDEIWDGKDVTEQLEALQQTMEEKVK